MSASVAGVVVVNAPSRWRFTFPAVPLYNDRYLVALLGPTLADTVGYRACVPSVP